MLYDADCGFCTRAALLVPRLRVDVDIASIQETDLAAAGVDPDRALVEMPFVGADGVVVYAHRAWVGILQTGPLPLRLLGQTLGSAVLSPLAARAYTWVATNRSRLPGGTAACSPDDQLGDATTR